MIEIIIMITMRRKYFLEEKLNKNGKNKLEVL